jgi:hypothetical protein
VIYITKCSLYLNFIYIYSQVFSVVSSCHAVDAPSVSDYVPNPMNRVRVMVATTSVICARSSFTLAGIGGTKPLSLTYPHTEKSRSVKSGDRVGQAIVPPPLIQATTVRLSQEVTSRWKCWSVASCWKIKSLSIYCCNYGMS